MPKTARYDLTYHPSYVPWRYAGHFVRPTHWAPFEPKVIRPSPEEGEAFVRQVLDEISAFAVEEFSLPATWRIRIMTITWHVWTSSAGCDREGPYVVFRLGDLHDKIDEEMAVVREYGIYRNDTEIGEVRSSDWRVHLRLVAAHEAAHAVQRSLPAVDTPLHLGRHVYAGLGPFGVSHGPFFQEIYRRLRRKFVNPFVPADAIGKAGARTRISTPPDLAGEPDPLAGTMFDHPRYGRCEVVRGLKSKVEVVTERSDDLWEDVPLARFKQMTATNTR